MADSRSEELLKSLLGEEAEIKDPQSRVEILLTKMLDSGVGGGGDWNVNDPDAKGYISNRPFYEYEEYEKELAYTAKKDSSGVSYRWRATEIDGVNYIKYQLKVSEANKDFNFQSLFNPYEQYEVELVLDGDDSYLSSLNFIPKWENLNYIEDEQYAFNPIQISNSSFIFKGYTLYDRSTNRKANWIDIFLQTPAGTEPAIGSYDTSVGFTINIYKKKTTDTIVYSEEFSTAQYENALNKYYSDGYYSGSGLWKNEEPIQYVERDKFENYFEQDALYRIDLEFFPSSGTEIIQKTSIYTVGFSIEENTPQSRASNSIVFKNGDLLYFKVWTSRESTSDDWTETFSVRVPIPKRMESSSCPARLGWKAVTIYKIEENPTIKRLVTIPDKYLPQTLTLGKGTEDEVTVTATQMKALLELLNA